MYYEIEKSIIEEIDRTLSGLNEKEVENMISIIEKSNRVFFVGVGRVLLSLKAIAKRWNHLGIQTVIVGDITEPAITDRDVLIVGSGSGRTAFPLIIAKKAKEFGAKVVHIGTDADCPMSQYRDAFVCIPTANKTQENSVSIQPMTSLFEQSILLLGDTISLMYIKKYNIDIPSLWKYHANLE